MARVVVRGDTVRMVYDDALLGLAQALGNVVIERASDVEWECAETRSETCECQKQGGLHWRAKMKSSGKVISEGMNRKKVIEEEIKYLEQHIL